MKLLPLLSLAIASLSSAADVPTEPLAQKGDVIFTDDFERTELGDWKTVIPTFTVEGGALKAVQTRDDHGAVGRISRPIKDAIVEFKFQLNGSPGFNAVFDDKNYKGSHAGHICRVAFAPKQIRIGDDKEGVMRNDIFEMRKDPAQKAAADKLLAGRGAAVPATLEQNKWYHVTIELVGDQLRVSLDGKPICHLKSPGIGHETKTSFHFTVNGPGALFDEVRIWQAR